MATTVITTEAPAPVDIFLLRYQLAREREMAEIAKAKKITSRPATKISNGSIGFCVCCGNLATLHLLFHYEESFHGEQFGWTVVEKHCDSCAKSHYPEVAT